MNVEALTPAERQTIEDAAAILARDPRTPEQRMAEAEAAEYAERMRASDEAFLNDPVAQAGAREAKRKAEAEHQRELAWMRSLANQDPRAIAHPREVKGEKSIWRCHECLSPAFTVRVVAESISLCERCWATHRLRCDACGAHKDVITSFCPPDGKWRCPACQVTFRAEYVADPKRFRNPHAIIAMSTLSHR